MWKPQSLRGSLVVAASVCGFLCATQTIAYPGAAGACPRKKAAVEEGEGHYLFDYSESSLSEAGFSVDLEPRMLVALQPSLITLSSPVNTTFRGFLMRIESDEDDDVFTFAPVNGSLSAQDAIVCGEWGDYVKGVTHSFNDDKKEVAADFIPTSEGVYFLDVTVVESNNAVDGSVYAYERIELRVFGNATDSPTQSPSVSFIPTLQNTTESVPTPFNVTSNASTIPLTFFMSSTPTPAPSIGGLSVISPISFPGVPTITTFSPTTTSECGSMNVLLLASALLSILVVSI